MSRAELADDGARWESIVDSETNQMKRTLIIISVMVSALSCTKPEIVVDKQKFEPVYRAGMAVDAATNVGVTYVRFMELVQNYATEVNLAKTKISNDRERLMLEKYEGALAEY